MHFQFLLTQNLSGGTPAPLDPLSFTRVVTLAPNNRDGEWRVSGERYCSGFRLPQSWGPVPRAATIFREMYSPPRGLPFSLALRKIPACDSRRIHRGRGSLHVCRFPPSRSSLAANFFKRASRQLWPRLRVRQRARLAWCLGLPRHRRPPRSIFSSNSTKSRSTICKKLFSQVTFLHVL